MKYTKSDAAISALTPEQYRVTRQAGTEPPYSGEYDEHDGIGIYRCVCCGAELFRSGAKFHSGSGWPSFHKPFDSDHIAYEQDHSLGMVRTEILCARCSGHLGSGWTGYERKPLRAGRKKPISHPAPAPGRPPAP